MSVITSAPASRTVLQNHLSTCLPGRSAVSRLNVFLALALAAASVSSLAGTARAVTLDWKTNPETTVVGSTSTSVNVVVDTTGLSVGQMVTGPGVPAGTTIASITDASNLVLSQATTTTDPAASLSFGVANAGVFSDSVNWLTATVPASSLVTDKARFNLASYGAFNPRLTAQRSINGLVFGDGVTATGAVAIGGSNLILGDGGIVMNANAGPVTFNNTLRLFSSQVWTNTSASTLTVNTTLNRRRDINASAQSIVGTLNITNTGGGSVVLTNHANDATGIIGPWISYTDLTGTYYATNTGGGTLGGFAGTAAATASAMTVATTNYNLNLAANDVLAINASANTVRYTGAAQTLQIDGASTLTTNGLLHAGTGKLTISAGAGATGGFVMGPAQETVILPHAGDIEIGARIINPATNVTGTRYNLTIGRSNTATPHTVGVNEIVNESSVILVLSGTMGPSAASSSNNFLTIGESRNLHLNAAAGDIYLGMGPIGNDNDTGSNADVGITDSPLGPSTVTISSAPGKLVGLNRSSTFTGGLILKPGASVYMHNWTNVVDVLGSGPITLEGNNTISKYLNSFTAGSNNRWNINGDVTFTGEPVGSAGGGTSNNSMTFFSTGATRPGSGEVHIGANNVTFNTNTPTDPMTPPYGNATISFGGLFDDGHSYNIIKTGAGTLRFNSSNLATGVGSTIQSANFTGSVTVNQGTFTLQDAFVMNRNNAIHVNTGAAFTQGGNPNIVGGFNDGASGGGTVSSTSATMSIHGSGNYAFSGVITSSGGGLAQDGNGTQALSGSNTYTGATTLSGGKLHLNFAGAGAPPTTDIIYRNITATTLNLAGGTLQLTGASAAANLQRVGAVSLSRASAITLVSNGAASLALTSGNMTRSTGGTVHVTLPDGTQSLTNGVLTGASNVNGIMGGFATVAGATPGSADWAVSGATHTSSQPFVSAVGNQTTGNTTIAVANTTGITVGSYVSGTGIPAGSTVTSIDPNVSVTITAGPTTTNATNTLSFVAPAVVGLTGSWDDGLAVGDQGNGLFIYGNLANGTAVSFNTLTAPGAQGSGINAGQVYYVIGSTPAQNYFKVVNVPGQTGPINAQPFTGGVLSIDVLGPITPLAGGGYTAFVGDGTDATTSNLLISGNASLTAATQTISSLKINPSGAGQSLNLGANQLTIDATLPDGVTHVGGLLFTGSNDFEIQGSGANGLTANGGDLVVHQYSVGTLTISAVIGNGTNATTLTKVGTGKLVLNAVNTFTGGVNLSGGTVEINSLAALGNGTAVAFSGGTLRYATGFTGSGDITTIADGTAGRGVTIAGNGATIDTNGNNITFGNAYGFVNPLSGNGGLTKTGAGTLTLNSNNAYAGNTTISGGVLEVGPNALIVNGAASNQIRTAGTNPVYNSAIGKSTNAASSLVLDGGTLRYLGAATSTDRNFTVTQNGGTIDSSNASNDAITWTNTSPVAMSGSGARTFTLTGTSTGLNSLGQSLGDGTGGATSVVKDGAGTWALTNANTYTGGTAVNAGTLLVKNATGSATGTAAVTLNGGTLGGNGKITGAVNPGTGAHTIAPSATLANTTATTLTLGALTTNATTTLAFNLVTPNVASGGSDRIVITDPSGLSLAGGTIAITGNPVGPSSLGYYKVIEYSGTFGSLAGITMPATVNKVVYLLDTLEDPGFIDIHRGFEGDANDDGTVAFVDFVALANNFGQSNTGWGGGDFNGDGSTSFADFVILANNFGQTIGGGALVSSSELALFQAASANFIAAHGAAVPEPASLALLGIGAAALLTRKRRK